VLQCGVVRDSLLQYGGITTYHVTDI